jgi:hypothetical protein
MTGDADSALSTLELSSFVLTDTAAFELRRKQFSTWGDGQPGSYRLVGRHATGKQRHLQKGSHAYLRTPWNCSRWNARIQARQGQPHASEHDARRFRDEPDWSFQSANHKQLHAF